MAVIHNVTIGLLLTIWTAHVLNQVRLRYYENYQIVLQDSEETQFEIQIQDGNIAIYVDWDGYHGSHFGFQDQGWRLP